MPTTNSNSEADDLDYLRNREPNFFYRAAQRSWFDRKAESDEEYLIASFAAELTNILTNESLQLLGESGMYPLAKDLYDDISQQDFEGALETAKKTDTDDASRIQVLDRIAYQLAVLITPEQIAAVLEDRLSADSGMFDDFEENTKNQLISINHDHARTRVDEIQLVRDSWLTIRNARTHHEDDFGSQQGNLETAERAAVVHERDRVTIQAPT